ncbi:hypothetical protein [Altericroceibacterium xinjiangense]|uniref:hypothetical protein n=1 Tax=Altericroceibacterium xinjiangense TaxID=762261 RepID=UPI000F7D90C5|nr:hypothetical protein [Altericroceibacterium xinjiangense]
MKTPEPIKSKRKGTRKRPTRTVAVTDAQRDELLQRALEEAKEAALRPPPPPKIAINEMIGEVARFVRECDPALTEQAVIEGVIKALNSGIFGGAFVAQAPGTIAERVKASLAEERSSQPIRIEDNSYPF